jgi:hypothetical protein
MDARFQQFFDTDTQHDFPLVESPRFWRRAIPRNTGLCLVLLWPASFTRNQRGQAVCCPFARSGEVRPRQKDRQAIKVAHQSNLYFAAELLYGNAS